MEKISLLLFCSIICTVMTIDVDYYLGIMRSKDCSGNDEDCSVQCNGAASVCLEGECYCHYSILDEVDVETHEVIDRKLTDFIDINDMIYEQTTEDERPAMRHHIAHFCENLNIGRTCIRKCMKLGKPAFCGKDHRCYCGHQYDAHSKDVATDAKKTYANFKDLYKKYFGKQPTTKDQIVESN